ncbi:MAG TPA: carbohydrate ABC transporter permease [Roseiflexaceae bacterium]|nr:carbohydrate ABC transporter permease [Roseiflexaceae bacterium]
MATTTQIRTSSTVRRRAFSASKLLDWAAIVLLGLGAIVMILPFLWMFSTSLRPAAESYKLPPAWLPTDWRFENYAAVFSSSVPIVAFALNSIKVTFFVTLGQLITCSMAGFAFARLRFPGRNLLFVLLLASLMVPGQVTIIPIFIIMRRLGLVDSHLALILPGLTSAFGVFLLRQFFLTLPQDLLDAAKIDGAGPWTAYLRIAIPLAGPSLAALTIITFNGTWNNFFNPYIFINTWERMTLPLGITALRGYLGSGNASVVMAAVALAILPVLVIFLLAQRWFITGVTRTGLKG